jgi:hypothetical protein
VERLQQDTVPVRTYVVGFAFGGSPGNLNCHAYYGGTARSDTCPFVTEATCSSGGAGSTGPCYYPADDEQQLVDAMSNIVGQVASCNYSLDQVPQEPDRLFVYFYYGCVNITDPDQCTSAPGCGWESGECVGDPMWLERDPSHIDNWDYDPQNNQILFFGSACEEVKDGLVTPVVIMGCCEGGEC